MNKKHSPEMKEFYEEFEAVINMLFRNNNDILDAMAYEKYEERLTSLEQKLLIIGHVGLLTKKQHIGTAYFFHKYNMMIHKLALEQHMKEGNYPDDTLRRLDQITDVLVNLTYKQIKKTLKV